MVGRQENGGDGGTGRGESRLPRFFHLVLLIEPLSDRRPGGFFSFFF